jgi:hypothetical protein
MPRGSDFEARWTEGAWAETKIIDALNAQPELLAVQFGITDGTAYWSSKEMEARDLTIKPVPFRATVLAELGGEDDAAGAAD